MSLKNTKLTHKKRVVTSGYILACGLFLMGCQTIRSWVADGSASVTKVSVPAQEFGRGFHTMTHLNGQIYIFGGMSEDSPSLPPVIGSGWRYDIATSQWTALPQAKQPAPRFAHVMVSGGQWLFVWGGQGRSGLLADGAIYDVVAKHWLPLPAITAEPRRHAEGVWTGKEFVIVGGLSQETPRAEIYAFNPQRATWRTVPPLPDGGRFGHTVLWYDGKLIIWGGIQKDGFAQNGWVMDWESQTWQTISDKRQPVPRSNHQAVMVGSRMFIWGGASESTRLADGGLYDSVGNTWRTGYEFEGVVGRTGHILVNFKSGVFLWGGRSGVRDYLADGVWVDFAEGTWRSFASPEVAARSLHAAVAVDDRIFVAGGFGLKDSKLHYFADAFWLNPVANLGQRHLISQTEGPASE